MRPHEPLELRSHLGQDATGPQAFLSGPPQTEIQQLACKLFTARLFYLSPGHDGRGRHHVDKAESQRSVYNVIYDHSHGLEDDIFLGTGPSKDVQRGFRWVHLPANNVR
jgi:hypothetical protein